MRDLFVDGLIGLLVLLSWSFDQLARRCASAVEVLEYRQAVVAHYRMLDERRDTVDIPIPVIDL